MPAKMKITFEFGKRQVAENLPDEQFITGPPKIAEMI
jgi:hypothetical protein